MTATAALALAAAFAPASQAVEATPDGPGNSEAAAARLCAMAATGQGPVVPLVWAASRKTGTGCPGDGSDLSGGGSGVISPREGFTSNHNEILVRP